MCKRSHSSGLQALSNIAYMSASHQHRVRLADNKIIFIMLVSSEVWAGGYFATISPDWSLLQNGRWTGCWASLCRVILINREENNQQCDRYTWGSRLHAGNVLCLCFVCCRYQRSRRRTSDSWDWTSNILNPQDPWGIENIVSYFTYFRAREKCTILIFICMEMGHLRSNVTPPPPVCSDLNICVQGAGCPPVRLTVDVDTMETGSGAGD